MNIELKEYQETAVDQLVGSVSDLLAKSLDNSVCIFQSPTGSGKTIIVAKFIDRLIKEQPGEDLCFLWLSVGKGDLHKQSKRSLEKIFEGAPRCILVEEEFSGSRDIISQNTVVVVNWEKLWDKDRLGNWKAKLMRDGENVNFREILDNTKQKRRIILIIDESHYASDTARTNELRELVNADVTLEMSATPKMLGAELNLLRGMPSPVPYSSNAYFVYVNPAEVIEQEMIKKELIINEGIDEIAAEIDDATSEAIILEAAFQKRLEQRAAYEAAGSKVNPLCLIQLPNADEGEEKRKRIEQFLKQKGVTKENEKLAIWLSGEKSDFVDKISENDNEIEFLIFKQAIDTGWDCPRASILVKLRETQSYTFEVQTVGRILRMPELKHYGNEVLNVGNIYSNLSSIIVRKEDYNPNLIKSLKAKRKPFYELLDLQSYYKSRVDYGDITRSFAPVLEQIFHDKLGLSNDFTLFQENIDRISKLGINFEAQDYQEFILDDVHIPAEIFDEIAGALNNETAGKREVKLSDGDLYDVFNQVIRGRLSGFAPRRSIPAVRTAIYQVFKKYFGIDAMKENGAIKIQRIFLANFNNFAPLVGQATGEYRPVKKAEARDRLNEDFYPWNIKKVEYYNEHDFKRPSNKYIYDKCYLKPNRSTPEKDFENHIDSHSNEAVVWWYKNADNGRDYFGIRYYENEMPQTFYPDFIMLLISGQIGIFDVKNGITAKTAGPKAEALAAYIKEENQNGKNLVGGILIRDRANAWRFNQKAVYSYDMNDLREWDRFDEII